MPVLARGTALKLSWVWIALALVLLGVAGCSKPENKLTEPRLRVVCSFLPVYVITQNVAQGVPGVEVKDLLPPASGCPHDYTLTTTQASLLEKADVLVFNGLGMEAFLQKTPFLQRKGRYVISASAVVDSIVGAFGGYELPAEKEASGHQHTDYQGTNPHAWVSPFEAAKMTRWIGQKLGQRDPDYSNNYQTNAERYASDLETLGRSLKERLAEAKNKRVVTLYPTFDYFMRDMELEIVDVGPVDFSQNPSARKLTELAQTIRQTQPVAIFSEPQFSSRQANLLSSETGVPVYELDPAVTGLADPHSYITIMRKNLQTLRQALKLKP